MAVCTRHPGQSGLSQNPEGRLSFCLRTSPRSSRVDGEGEHFNDLVQTSVTAQKRIETFKERVGSPVGTSKPIHLTGAQRDDAASLIDSLLVQEEQYQLWLGSWQGASQSVLDGVQTREAMDSYIHRAGVAAA
jgi:hypothetical protein